MAREIKFRVWDNEFNEYSSYHLNKALVNEINNYDRFLFEEYTGLKDKNGVEIYEGDIVVFEGNTKVHEVKFEEGGFRLFEPEGRVLVYTIKGTVIEVIGNIHQNP